MPIHAHQELRVFLVLSGALWSLLWGLSGSFAQEADATLLSFLPHMHLRGKLFDYNLIRKRMGTEGKPDYEIEPLVRVNYHFHWQMSDRISEPRFLRAGAELLNSKASPHNPDWQAEVRWGEQIYDEMMVGFFDVAVPAGVDKQHFFARTKLNYKFSDRPVLRDRPSAVGPVRLCYLQFDYARHRNSVRGKPLCYIGRLELSEHH